MKRAYIAVLLSAALAAASGCAESVATIQTVHPPLGHRKVETSQAAYQFSTGRIIEIALARQWILGGGEAVPDYEYIYISVPDRAGRHEVGQPGVELHRLVRIEREEFLYKATSGTIKYRFAFLTKDHVHADFDVQTELVPRPDLGAKSYPLKGTIKAAESITVAQGLINKYRDNVERIATPPAPPAAEEAPAETSK